MAVINRIERIARDLTHLEINTIVKPGMTGRKMPRPRIAMKEIARKYLLHLAKIDASKSECTEIIGSYQSFEIIKETAQSFFDRYDTQNMTDKLKGERAVLFRILSFSEQIMEIMRDLREQGVETWDNALNQDAIEKMKESLPLKTEELVKIRKIWEMGLEVIAMQTIVQLDGDVVTRVHPKYATESFKALQQIHNDSIELSTSIWSNLIHTVKDFFSSMKGKSGKGK